ncbi:MAG TPA: phosphohydrolase, partial [Roseiflexaceae bacterium]|nr:phosphohydrolase [Roseiflexaceae bacterium]
MVRSAADQRRRQTWQLVFASCVLALALWGILAVRPPTSPGLELGSPSPRDVRANQTLAFQSEVLTEEKRFRAENAPDTVVYTRDSNVPIAQRAQLVELLQTISQIRDDPSLGSDAETAKLTSLPNSTLVVSPELATTIATLSDDEWNDVRLQTLTVYDRATARYDFALNAEAVADLRERLLPYWSAQLGRGKAPQIIQLFVSSFL